MSRRRRRKITVRDATCDVVQIRLRRTSTASSHDAGQYYQSNHSFVLLNYKDTGVNRQTDVYDNIEPTNNTLASSTSS
jgi:hypothetical protein